MLPLLQDQVIFAYERSAPPPLSCWLNWCMPQDISFRLVENTNLEIYYTQLYLQVQQVRNLAYGT